MSTNPNLTSPLKKIVYESKWFVMKQASACLFGGCLLALIALSTFVDIPGISRYDALFIGALLIQVFLMVFRLETHKETKIIFLFHFIATLMELFKTSESIGAWTYPEANVFRIANVPLFAGFMYSAVGSYLARAWRIFDFRFTGYPPFWTTFLIAFLAYTNFYTHHFWIDIRLAIFVAIGLIYRRCRIYFKITNREYHIPIIALFLLIAILIWIAENAGTYFQVWLYPHQIEQWTPVGIDKIGAWFILMIVSFVLVSSLYREDLNGKH